MRPPRTWVSGTAYPETWHSGKAMRLRSSGCGSYSMTDSSIAAVRLRCESMAPFGKPVVPLV